MSRVENKILSIIKEVCEPREPNLSDYDQPFLEIGLDSLDFSTLLMTLEDEFDVKFSGDDMEKFNTINKVKNIIETSASG